MINIDDIILTVEDNTYTFSFKTNIIPEHIFNKKRKEIESMFDLYRFQMDTIMTREKMKYEILRILNTNIRKEKLDRINRNCRDY